VEQGAVVAGTITLCPLPVAALSYNDGCNLRFVDLAALSSDWGQFQPRRSQENISASLAGNSASANLLD